MDITNYLLKKKQVKSININDEGSYFNSLPFQCPKCHWGTDTLSEYAIHLENHLTKKKRRVKIGKKER